VIAPRLVRKIVYVRSRLGELQRTLDGLLRELTNEAGYDKMAVTIGRDSGVSGTRLGRSRSRAEPNQLPLLGGVDMVILEVPEGDPRKVAPSKPQGS